MGLLGQLIDGASTPPGRYIKHPSATGTTDLQDGNPLDSGSAMIIDNDLAMLSMENVRHLVLDVGPGTVGGGNSRGFAGLDDVQEPTAADFSGAGVLQQISWAPSVARVYGPFAMVADRALPDAGYGFRNVRLDVDCSSGGSATLAIIAALMAGYVYPDTAQPLAYAALATTGTGRQTISLTLSAQATGDAASETTFRCRPATNVATAFCTIPDVYLFVGWNFTNGSDAVIGLSAWEVGGDR